MPLWTSEPARPARVGDSGYDSWWLYWFKKFADDLPKRHKEMDEEQLRIYRLSTDFWREWRIYKQNKWYETGK